MAGLHLAANEESQAAAAPAALVGAVKGAHSVSPAALPDYPAPGPPASNPPLGSQRVRATAALIESDPATSLSGLRMQCAVSVPGAAFTAAALQPPTPGAAAVPPDPHRC